MKRRLLADWSDINFIIGTNPEDYIELRFLVTEQLDAVKGLQAYMNTMVNSDEKLSKYNLRKVTTFWGLRSSIGNMNQADDTQTEEHQEYIYYMFAPPWARHAKPVLYL